MAGLDRAPEWWSAQVRQIRKNRTRSGCGGGDPEPGVGDTGRGDSGNRKERGEEVGESGQGAQNGERTIGEEGVRNWGRDAEDLKGVEGGLQAGGSIRGEAQEAGSVDWGQKRQPREESHGGEVRGSRRFAEIWADEGEDRGARHSQGP